MRFAAPGCGFSPRALDEPTSQRFWVYKVRESPPAIDLHDREMLSIARLEVRLAADVDELEVELELVLYSADDLERTRAEGAVDGVVERDARYG